MSVLSSVRPRAPGERSQAEFVRARVESLHVSTLNARGAPTRSQIASVIVALSAPACVCIFRPATAAHLLHDLFFAIFACATAIRVAAVLIAPKSPSAALLLDHELPTYTIIVPLRGEAAMIEPLLTALADIDYPTTRLQILLALEHDDLPTRRAVANADLPSHLRPLVVPPGYPLTKPRACNAALEQATGEHVVVYDAEDRPDPDQLREAASRFRRAPPEVTCLQAPLRIPLGGRFSSRQFALEYAALFDVLLPAYARLNSAFPLGGTSNHFRTAALRTLGGWDAWNVTEDADLGFRLAAAGMRCGMLSRPTFEDAPQDFGEWLPQRGRWLKGYMQTWLVYMWRPGRCGLAWFAALQATVGLTILSALVHAPIALLMAVSVMSAVTPWGILVSWEDIVLFACGWAAAALAITVGAQRAGLKPRVLDVLLAPAYWSLQTVAFWRAMRQLLTQPHRWDKTPHHPPEPSPAEPEPEAAALHPAE